MVRKNRHEISGRENEPRAWWAPTRYGYGAGLPIAGDASAFSPASVRAITSSSGDGDSGTRAPSGSTTAIGRLRPP